MEDNQSDEELLLYIPAPMQSNLKQIHADVNCDESRKNLRYFTIKDLEQFQYTRNDAFECCVPKTRVCDYEKKVYTNTKPVSDPCRESCIPPMSLLIKWQLELQKGVPAAENHYIEYSYTGKVSRFDLNAVKMAQRLHTVREVKDCVEKELMFLSSSRNKPRCISKEMDIAALKRFRQLIHHSNNATSLDDYGMQPGELARLCGRRYLSDEHMLWVCEYLNSAQNDTICIYANFINDVETFCQRKQRNELYLPSKIVLIINVGSTQTGDVFIANQNRMGCHFVVAVYNEQDNSLVYGDSLGWKIPNGLVDLVNRYTRSFFEKYVEEVVLCHASAGTHNGIHNCVSECKNYYPLQRDGDICGVVVILISCIVSLSPIFWDFIVSITHQDRENMPYFYIREPSKYHKYLRMIMITWFANKYIDMEYVLPRQWLYGNESENSSDSDDNEDVPRVDVEESKTDQSKDGKKKKVNVDDLGRISCDFCDELFSRKDSLNRHVKRKHKEEDIGIDTSSWKCLCFECGKRFYKTNHLKSHLGQDHGFQFITEVTHHDSKEEFHEWKEELELNHRCNFVSLRGKASNKVDENVSYFKCNRSGVFKPKRAGKRRQKSSGTRKIERNCTASMKTTIHDDGSTTTETCLTHYGHKTELQHLNLPKGFKQQIAAKLKQGVAQDKILDTIRDNVGENITREHLTEEQDIRNIALAFGIDEIRRHENDQESVLSWINEWEDKDDNPILYYKLQGNKDETDIEEEDFMIVIQTKAQCYMMQQFADNGVCCDTTHGTTGYDFKLTTLIVMDDFQEGVHFKQGDLPIH